MVKFDVVPPFREYETRDSFVSRLAALNQITSVFEMARLLGETNAPENRGPRFERFAAMAGIDPARFGPYTVREDGVFMILGGHRFHRNHLCRRDPRFCPACVCEDVAAGKGPIGARTYQRFWWLLTIIERCPKHGCDMITGRNPDGSSVPDLSAYITQNFEHVRAALATAEKAGSTSSLDQYLHARLVGCPAPNDFLDSLPLNYLVRFCDAIGHDNVTSAGSASPVETIRRGFDLLSMGRTRFFEFLDHSSRQPDGGRNFGRSARYGRAYTILSTEVEDPVWSPIRELYWLDAKTRFPLGPGEDFLGYTLEKRLLHSLYTASREYGIHINTVTKLLGREVIARYETQEDAPHSALVPADIARPLLDRFHTSVTAQEASQMLGVSATILRQLANAGHLRAIEAGLGRGKSRTRFDREDLNTMLAFLATLPTGRIRGAYRSFVTMYQWGSMRAAEAYALILDNKVRCVRKQGEPSFEKLYVDYWDLTKANPAYLETGYSLQEASRSLSTSLATVKGLVESGYLVTRNSASKFGRKYDFRLDEEALQKFKREYGGMTNIANDLGIAVTRVSSAIKAEGIEPIFPATRTFHGNLETRTYERQRVIDALLAHDPDYRKFKVG
jgi:hypothetical protein